MRRPSAQGLAALAASTALLGGTGVALATNSASAKPATAKTATASRDNRAAERDAFLASVASNLGVSKDKLVAAIKSAALQRVDAALTAGTITADQAKAMKVAIESGQGPGLGGYGFGERGSGGPGAHGGLDAAATYLGLSGAELRTDLEAGKSLADVAKTQGKTVAGLEAAMLADAKSHLDADVKAGRITAEQEQAMLTELSTHLDDIVNNAGPVGPAGPPRPAF